MKDDSFREELEACAPRNKVMQFLRLFVLVAFGLVAVCLCWFSWEIVKARRSPGGEPQKRIMRIPKPVGNPKAKVRVDLIIPSHTACQLETAEFLMFLARTYPHIIYVVYSDMFADDKNGEPVQQEACSSVFINGEDTFELEQPNGQTERVLLSGPSGGEYTLEELVEILKLEFKKAGVEAPKDIDTIITRFRKADRKSLDAKFMLDPNMDLEKSGAYKQPARKVDAPPI